MSSYATGRRPMARTSKARRSAQGSDNDAKFRQDALDDRMGLADADMELKSRRATSALMSPLSSHALPIIELLPVIHGIDPNDHPFGLDGPINDFARKPAVTCTLGSAPCAWHKPQPGPIDASPRPHMTAGRRHTGSTPVYHSDGKEKKPPGVADTRARKLETNVLLLSRKRNRTANQRMDVNDAPSDDRDDELDSLMHSRKSNTRACMRRCKAKQTRSEKRSLWTNFR